MTERTNTVLQVLAIASIAIGVSVLELWVGRLLGFEWWQVLLVAAAISLLKLRRAEVGKNDRQT